MGLKPLFAQDPSLSWWGESRAGGYNNFEVGGWAVTQKYAGGGRTKPLRKPGAPAGFNHLVDRRTMNEFTPSFTKRKSRWIHLIRSASPCSGFALITVDTWSLWIFAFLARYWYPGLVDPSLLRPSSDAVVLERWPKNTSALSYRMNGNIGNT